MKKYTWFLLLFPIFAFGGTPKAHGWCSIEIFEDGKQFFGEKQEEIGDAHNMADELTWHGACKRGERCEFRFGCPEALKLYKLDDSRIHVASMEYDEGKWGRKKQYEERSEYFMTASIPPPPADMLKYKTRDIFASCIGAPNTINVGYPRRIKVDIKTGEVQDLTPYDMLRQQRAKNRIFWVGCWIGRIAFLSPFLIFVAIPICVVLFRPIYRVFYPRKGKTDKGRQEK